jgi:hypothetical protein
MKKSQTRGLALLLSLALAFSLFCGLSAGAYAADYEERDVWTINLHTYNSAPVVTVTRLEYAYATSLSGITVSGVGYTVDADAIANTVIRDEYDNVRQATFSAAAASASAVEIAESTAPLTIVVDGVTKTYARSDLSGIVTKSSLSYNGKTADNVSFYGITTEYVTIGGLLGFLNVTEASLVNIKFRPIDWEGNSTYIRTLTASEIGSAILSIKGYQSGDPAQVSANRADTLNALRLISGMAGGTAFQNVKWVDYIEITTNGSGSGTGNDTGGIPVGDSTGGDTVTTPPDAPPVDNGDGSVTLPGGGTIETPGGVTVDVPGGTVIGGDGTITFPPDSDGGTVTTPGNTEITVPGGSTIAPDGTITVGSGGATITFPGGMSVHVEEATVIILDEDTPLGYYVSIDNPFIDADQGAWYYDDLLFAYAHGLMKGTAADKFAPNSNLTRAMLITLLARLDGVDTTVGETWYSAAVEWGVGSGVTDGSNLQGDVTREQLVTMLWRFAGSPQVGGSVVFGDAENISGYASDAVAWAVANGIVHGKPGNLFDPQGSATRAEVAAVLRRFIEAAK